MKNYAKRMARDADGESIQWAPAPFLSNARYNDDNGVTSSVISLHPMTSRVEVAAVGGQGVVIRWIPTTETATVSPFASVVSSGLGANFDHSVPANTYRLFVVPQETQGAPSGQVGSINGLYQRLAIINSGTSPSSVLLSEF